MQRWRRAGPLWTGSGQALQAAACMWLIDRSRLSRPAVNAQFSRWRGAPLMAPPGLPCLRTGLAGCGRQHRPDGQEHDEEALYPPVLRAHRRRDLARPDRDPGRQRRPHLHQGRPGRGAAPPPGSLWPCCAPRRAAARCGRMHLAACRSCVVQQLSAWWVAGSWKWQAPVPVPACGDCQNPTLPTMDPASLSICAHSMGQMFLFAHGHEIVGKSACPALCSCAMR